MPTYELTLLLKTMPRQELGSVLKRTANYIFDQGGFIRKINNLGKLKICVKKLDLGIEGIVSTEALLSQH